MSWTDFRIAEDESYRSALHLEAALSQAAFSALRPEFLTAVEADAAAGYPGLEGLQACRGLTRAERLIEAHFAQIIADDPDGFIRQYMDLAHAEAGHEGYVNADMARMLYPPYAASLEARGFMEKATIAPAGYLALNLVWNEVLARSEYDERPEALFVAGGMASGKSTRAVRDENTRRVSATVFDSVFGNLARAEFVVSQTIEAASSRTSF